MNSSHLLSIITFIYGLSAFLYLAAWIFKKEGLPLELADKLTIYVVISTIIGARLGHCLFYEFSYYIQNPLEIILPWADTKAGSGLVAMKSCVTKHFQPMRMRFPC